jgi:serine phosphatase RsbU (regulator of sigma subunit)/anti-sigma regulatory factor (Ser/Thr protein kinase)
METERVTEHQQPATSTAVPPLPPVGTPTTGGPAGHLGVPAGTTDLSGGTESARDPLPELSGPPGGFGHDSGLSTSRASHDDELSPPSPAGDGVEQVRPSSRRKSGAGKPSGNSSGKQSGKSSGNSSGKSSGHEDAGAARGSGAGARDGKGRAVPEPSHGPESDPQSASPSQASSQPSTAESGAVSHPTTGDMTAAEVPPNSSSDAASDPPSGPAPVRDVAAQDGDAAERERRGGDRLRFVGAATRRIARGMDLDETVLGLCRASVPAYSDAILVYLRDPLPVGDERPTGPVVLRLRRSDRIPDDPSALVAAVTAGAEQPQPDGDAGAAGADATAAASATGSPVPSLSAVADGTAGATEYVEVLAGGPLAEVLRGVRPVFADAPAARDALPELLGTDPEVPSGHRVILAPLRGRRKVIGAAIFLRRPERAAFEPDDLLIAAQLATHTALGVDKAVLYGREAYIADELQRTMLPDELPQPTGCHLASRYLPAAETARVGGDWYDAIPLPGSRVALVVGDVMGHSMTSAAIMGQLRTTAQTLAGLDLPPQEVLHHLDEQAQRLGSDRMATCLYAVYDPVAHRIVIANAGHPPPVLLHRDGRAEVLRIPAGAPIGVGGVDFEAVELDAPAGATLLLYTDGLVESRQRDVWTGIEHLREKLTATARLTRPDASAPLEPLCDEVLDILGPGDRDDDIALLAARFDGIAPSDVAYWFLDPRAQTAGQARRLARRALSRWGLEELSDSVELLVSEVVTNAVRYAERPITLRLLRTDTLRCEVGDDVPQLPRLRQARATDEGGRGLYLVNRLARRWGATRLSTGKVVWFELPVS